MTRAAPSACCTATSSFAVAVADAVAVGGAGATFTVVTGEVAQDPPGLIREYLRPRPWTQTCGKKSVTDSGEGPCLDVSMSRIMEISPAASSRGKIRLQALRNCKWHRSKARGLQIRRALLEVGYSSFPAQLGPGVDGSVSGPKSLERRILGVGLSCLESLRPLWLLVGKA